MSNYTLYDYGVHTDDIVTEVKTSELEAIDFEAEVEGSNEDYIIRPTITLTTYGEPFARYGIFNRKTGLQEAESYQLVTAQAYARRLSELLRKGLMDDESNVTQLPGLEGPPTVN